MHIFSNAKWINQFVYPYNNFEAIPQADFDAININLDNVRNDEPLVSILIAAWNEEVNVLRCVASLAKTKSKYAFEIIVIDNNSTDKTKQTVEKLHIKYLFQEIQGCGPARQLGQENAKGKYILIADADCIYPDCWVDKMIDKLSQPGTVCVYGRYSFISEKRYPRWKLFMLEKMKDIITEVRHFKRPFLSCYGISMGYVKEYGLKVGFVMYKIWGDDGRLAFDLMQFGKIKQMKSDAARPYTSPRTLDRDGSFGKALAARLKKETGRFFTMFKPMAPHDTKTSTND